jgi:dihydroorotate dehydrogenase
MGNPKPRVFRLTEDRAIINRYGFNSEGHQAVHSRLQALKTFGFQGIIGVNLGKNKQTAYPNIDFIEGIIKFSDVADYFVVNISSPNTPGLRSLQNRLELEELLTSINEVRSAMPRKPPLLLKIAPDLSDQEQQDVAEVVQQHQTMVDGIIISNTTVSRSNLVNDVSTTFSRRSFSKDSFLFLIRIIIERTFSRV